MNILIPMAGNGSRFSNAGYVDPKPLISVNGLPMIRRVVESLNIFGDYIFVVQQKHRKQYELDRVLNTTVQQVFPTEIMGTHGVTKRDGNVYTKPVTIVEVDAITRGQACSVLLAKEYIDNNESLLIVNSDTMYGWTNHAPHSWEGIHHSEHSCNFLNELKRTDPDGCIVTYKTVDPSWSFAKTNESGYVVKTAEKIPISDNGTVGIYYWKHGSDFVKYAEQMISKNIRTNNEFYVCPVYNEAILDEKQITIYQMNRVFSMGTPEDMKHSVKKLWGSDL